MAALHIWHPAYVATEPAQLEMFITLGDSLSLARGTDSLVRAALDVLGIAAPARSWSCEAARTHYFGSYRDEPGETWQAAWDLAWRLRVELDAEAGLPIIPALGYFDLEDIDASHRFSDDPEQWSSWPCLVIADVPDDHTLAASQQLLFARFPQAALTVGQAYGEVVQLRAFLGVWPRSVYEAGALAAEALLEELVRVGASVRCDDTQRLLGP